MNNSQQISDLCASSRVHFIKATAILRESLCKNLSNVELVSLMIEENNTEGLKWILDKAPIDRLNITKDLSDSYELIENYFSHE